MTSLKRIRKLVKQPVCFLFNFYYPTHTPTGFLYIYIYISYYICYRYCIYIHQYIYLYNTRTTLLQYEYLKCSTNYRVIQISWHLGIWISPHRHRHSSMNIVFYTVETAYRITTQFYILNVLNTSFSVDLQPTCGGLQFS